MREKMFIAVALVGFSLLANLGLTAALALPFTLIWNLSVVAAFGWPALTYFQSVGALALVCLGKTIWTGVEVSLKLRD